MVTTFAMPPQRFYIDPGEQPVQLLDGHFDDFGFLWLRSLRLRSLRLRHWLLLRWLPHLLYRLPWPDEAISFQPFHAQPVAVALPAEYLDPVAPLIPKYVQRGGERVECQALLSPLMLLRKSTASRCR